MKKIHRLISLWAILIPFTAISQLKVDSIGRTYVGGVSDAMMLADTASTIPLRIIGLLHPQYNYNQAARIGFGNDNGKLYIGEIAQYSNRLQIHGEEGVYITSKDGNTSLSVITYDVSDTNRVLKINPPKTSVNALYYTSLWQPSDQNFKQNIVQLENAMDKLGRLQGVSYRMNMAQNPMMGNQLSLNTLNVEMQNTVQEVATDTTRHMGFIAQELKEVFPELVTNDSEGNLYVDYVSLIPVIVEALKEQQTVIEAQAAKIEELNDAVEAIENPLFPSSRQAQLTTNNQAASAESAINAFLYQNTPNPFGHSTEIRYFLPAGTTGANLCIFNLQGLLIKTYPIEGSGEGAVEIYSSDLGNPGMYIYSLLIGGKEVDTKRMIVGQ